jgi:hypothetical protein
MKPFDLEKALAGKAVITEGGCIVEEIHLIKSLDVVLAVIEGDIHFFDRTGSKEYFQFGNLELFMAPEKAKLYVVVGIFATGNVFSECFTTRSCAEYFLKTHDHSAYKFYPTVTEIEVEEK